MVQDMDEVEREALAYYDKAQEYDMNWQMRLAEMYYRKAYETLKGWLQL